MKRAFVLAVLLMVVTSLAMAKGSGSDGLLQGAGQISVNHADPGEGGTDCSYLDRTVKGSWVPNYIDARGWVCDKTAECEAGAASVIILTGPWALEYNPAFYAAAALEAGCVVASYTVGCYQEDRNYQEGYKRHVTEYTGYWLNDACRSQILDDYWEYDH